VGFEQTAPLDNRRRKTMKKLFHLTESGVEELQAEKQLLLVKRVGTAEAIKVARELGDLSENAEYQSARQEQERTDGRLEEIDHILANVEIIKAKKSKQVVLGSTVTLRHPDGNEVTVQIVGTIHPFAKLDLRKTSHYPGYSSPR
jgi:transcription elongation factor GreA